LQRLSEDRDGFVISKQVQQLQLRDEGYDANHTQEKLVVVDHRLKTDDFS